MRMIYAVAALCAAALASASAQELSPERRAFRELYRELVEIDTSVATGACTPAAEAMAARLRAAGFPESDVQVITPEGWPTEGNLVARIPGRSSDRAVLLLAHIDVVNANRADWERDPFTLIEENGFFYGRGTTDDKSMAAVFTDMMIEFRRENLRPRRTIKMALTCGEETSERFNGLSYLIEHHRDWVQADFALNEGADGELSPDGRRVALNVQAGEKVYQLFTLTVTNPGGHSSRPVPENAIYRLSAALQRLSQHQFPVELNPVTRGYLSAMAPIVGGEDAAAMTALARDPQNAEAAAFLSRDPAYNAIMRTTCVATQLTAGHAANALPQRAVATVNCRALQGHSAEEIRDVLQRVINDEQVTIEIVERGESSAAPDLRRDVMGPIERAAARMWPGVPVVPLMATSATDGRYLIGAGIPTYGVSGRFMVRGESNIHGLNEKLRVQSLYESRDFLEAIVRDYARQ
ncbi:MAG: M20/M25/M40 family metallo-hydrolase [Alphaproteobacteria bacterium]|nr:M20/M25/M40 family metallo-hydrolase [Alphaproteobacteria bacterium]